jgi:outer membrane protein insertion porin family
MATLFAAAIPENETIAAISVKGNSAVAEGTILAAIKTKPGDKVSAEAIKKDMQAIYNLGYFFDVSTDFLKQEDGVKVTYQVVENPVVREIVVKGNTVLPAAKILEMLKNIQGTILNAQTLGQGVKEIEGKYHEQGYILAKVSDVAMNEQGVLTLTINEGKLEAISVTGNKKTKDYVITREMTVKPGQPLNVKDARRSMQKVYNLGYFEDVNMKLNPGKELNGVVLETQVKEQKTASVSLGGGYSSSDGLIGFVEFNDPNFRGTGDQIKIHWEFGGDTNTSHNYSAAFTRPWLDKKQTSIGFSVYDTTKERDEYWDEDKYPDHASNEVRSTYDERRKGFNITLGRPQSEYRKNYITLKDEKSSFVELESGMEPEGPFGETRSIILQSVLDTRDNVFNATEGERLSLSAEFAGTLLGGDFTFQKYQVDQRKYKKIGNNRVLAYRVSAGLISGDVPHSEEFTLGGSNSLRGYEEDEFDGTKMIMASAEYRFPLGSKLQGVGFIDVGQASESWSLGELKTSTGVGVRISTPIGPLRLDYGIGDEGGRFHFAIGNSF